jgi:tetratricopeptide (TPR) repeat protein
MSDGEEFRNSDENNKRATLCYKRGVEGMEKQNWDLATEMFMAAVKFAPDKVNFRQLLRKCTEKRFKDNKSGAGTLTKMKLTGIRSRIKKAKADKKWGDADLACEEGLTINPWDVGLNVELGDVAVGRGFSDIAKWSYAYARQLDPKNREINVKLADVLRDRGEYDEATNIWQYLYNLDPRDAEARTKMTGLQSQKVAEQGYEGATSTKDARKDKESLNKPKELLAPGQSAELDLKHAIRKEPQRIENYLKLSEHLKRSHKLDEAREVLNQGLQASGNDVNVREQLEDVELLLLDRNLETAKIDAGQTQDEKARVMVRQLAEELLKQRTEVLVRRVERYPADLGKKYELGLCYMKVQNWPQAIPLLQRATQDPRQKVKALFNLGKCFMYDKKLSLARGQFERAIPDLNFDTDPDLFKETYYWAGRVVEELKDLPKAEEYYGKILERDYEYKDTRERLEKIQGG